LGQGFKILTSDRYSAYNWLAVSQRQICWAHLKRDFTQVQNERGIGRSGSRLAGAGETHLFVVSSPRWHLVSSRFERGFAIRSRVHELLITAATNEIGTREKTPWAKNGANLSAIAPGRASTVAICDYRWGETNNAAERAVPLSYGDAPVSGLRVKREVFFVARMLSVMTTLRSQNPDVLLFSPSLSGGTPRKPAPSLLPLLPSLTELDLPAA